MRYGVFAVLLLIALVLTDDLHHLGANLLQVNPEAFKDASGYSLTLSHQSQQQVLGPDVVVVESPR